MPIRKKEILTIDTKVYQYPDGSYLPDCAQPWPQSPSIYSPHHSTRYINVSSEKNSTVKSRKDENVGLLPELYKKREECCGCSACYSSCPMSGKGKSGEQFIHSLQSAKYGLFQKLKLTGAITMLPDEEGFLYPVVDAEICIRCYKCIAVCPMKNN